MMFKPEVLVLTLAATMMMARGLQIGRRELLASAFVGWTTTTPKPANAEDGVQLFAKNCAACHAGGGNIVARTKTLSAADLNRDGYSSLEKMAEIIALGKNAMPGYGEACQPKLACTFGPHLSEDEVNSVAEFVLDQAQAGWPQS
ncbi:hypothetical protein CTAYLR_010304 [Chrysophaeum taylorii]|uniref:Cytochrome c-553 n=1 Tax=Chrysophaeum taylorii TaxID=2483200 RepID=A0AAD7UIN7_9STRA|nr:hypothetical protein CTAYLR_010304 [Chrysophaeum taylorii]